MIWRRKPSRAEILGREQWRLDRANGLLLEARCLVEELKAALAAADRIARPS